MERGSDLHGPRVDEEMKREAESRALPDTVYGNVEEVWEALGGRRERRDGARHPTLTVTVVDAAGLREALEAAPS